MAFRKHKFSEEQLHRVLEVLKSHDLLDEVVSLTDFKIKLLQEITFTGFFEKREGICVNWNKVVGSSNDIVSILAKEWKGFSGNSSYPIKSGDRNLTPYMAFHLTFDMWNTESYYGRARHRLNNFLVQLIKALIAQYKKDNT